MTRSTQKNAEQLVHENAVLRTQLERTNEALQTAQRNYTDCAQRLRRSSLIQELGHALTQVTDEPEFFRHTAQFLRGMFPDVARVSITLRKREERDVLQLYASDGIDDLFARGATLPLRESSASWVYRNRRMLFLQGEELNNSPLNRKLLAGGVRSVVMAPLIIGSDCIGTLNVAASQMDVFTEQEREFLAQIAEVVARSCERWRLVESLQQALHESREKAADLAHAKELADSANAAKTAFLSSISHELRTPLNAVIGFAELIERSGDLDRVRGEYIEAIRSSSTQLLSLINNLLQLSKIEAGHETHDEIVCEIRSLLADVHRMLIHQAMAKGLKLVVECDSRVPVSVVLDAGKLRQVLINLLNNALKFTDEGEVELHLDVVGDALQITVRDTGPGIPEAEVDTLFEPFIQTRVGRARADGTGLGLAITKRLIAVMGGSDISVGRADPHGAVFSFAIPLRLPTDRQREVERARPRVVGLAGDAGDSDIPRLLVADDNRLNRRLLMALLKSVGFQVRGATDGLEAVACWQTWRPQLIWMDMQMPRLDGMAATRRIRAREGERRPIIIALTASAFEGDRDDALAAGCDGFLCKPFAAFEIFDAIAYWLPVTYLYESDSEPGS